MSSQAKELPWSMVSCKNFNDEEESPQREVMAKRRHEKPSKATSDGGRAGKPEKTPAKLKVAPPRFRDPEPNQLGAEMAQSTRILLRYRLVTFQLNKPPFANAISYELSFAKEPPAATSAKESIFGKRISELYQCHSSLCGFDFFVILCVGAI